MTGLVTGQSLPTLYRVTGRNFTAGFEAQGETVIRHAPILQKWIRGCGYKLEPTLTALFKAGFVVRVVGTSSV